MIIPNPCDWIIDRLENDKPFFAVRINDGEMINMFQTRPEGTVLGTDKSPASVDYDLGDDLLRMFRGMSTKKGKEDCLIGCSWNTERADDMGRGPFTEEVRCLDMWDANWCHEHWPLEGVVDGSTRKLLEYLGDCGNAVNLVTCEALMGARKCMGRGTSVFLVPSGESYWYMEDAYMFLEECANAGHVFVWAGGIGMKPTAWQLFKHHPQSSHIDIGHLFNGAFGFKDYGWLQRGDGPWYEPYFRKGGFADWVQACVKGKS